MKSRQSLPFAEAPATGCSRRSPIRLVWAIGLLWPCAAAVAQAQVQWRTPDRFVVPAADIEQEPTSAPPDTSKPANQSPSPSPAPAGYPGYPLAGGGSAAGQRTTLPPPEAADDWVLRPEGDDREEFQDPCQSCRPRFCWQPFADRFEVRAEWLLWWSKGNHVPPLVTTGSMSQAQTDSGVLGVPGTAIVFGDSGLNEAARSGGRLTLDYWLTCDHSLALEAQYIGLGDNTQTFAASNLSDPYLARPFFNVDTLANDAGRTAYPDVQDGNIAIAAKTDFQGAELLLRRPWFCSPRARLDLLVGYRYLRLADDLSFTENDTFTDPTGASTGGAPVGSTLKLIDHFSTLNEFQGVDLGLDTDWHWRNWSLGFLLKVGLGNTRSHVIINGSTTFTEPANPPLTGTSPGGFLAPSNGVYEQHSQFSVVPELGLNLGFDLTPRLRLVAGYTLIYWSGVARTGDQIDLNLAPSQFAQFPPVQNTSPFPQNRYVITDYWAQGVNVGAEFRF